MLVSTWITRYSILFLLDNIKLGGKKQNQIKSTLMFNILVQRFTVLLIKNYKIQLPALLFFAGLLELHQQIYIFYKFVGFYSTLMYSIVKGTTSP